jgi:endonuclease YncB( thermonuclease family)
MRPSDPRPPISPSRAKVTALRDWRHHRRKAAIIQRVRSWAAPSALVLGLLAVAIAWNGVGSPWSSDAPPAVQLRSGDTFDGRYAVLIDSNTIGIGQERIRISNIDAPESFNPRCGEERVAGLKVKERMAQVIRVEKVGIRREGQDPDGRTPARITVNGQDLGDMLIREGLVLPWRDGPDARMARARHWCG